MRLELDGGLQLTNGLVQFSLFPQLEPEVVVPFGGERRMLPKDLAQQRDCAARSPRFQQAALRAYRASRRPGSLKSAASYSVIASDERPMRS